MGMLGNEETYNLSCKAAETRGLLRFIHWLLLRHDGEFKASNDTAYQATMLLQAAASALQMDDVLSVHGRVLDRTSCQQLLHAYIRFLLFYRRALGVLKPKCHLMFHLIQRCLYKGNARLYSTYRDESLNGTFAKIRKVRA